MNTARSPALTSFLLFSSSADTDPSATAISTSPSSRTAAVKEVPRTPAVTVTDSTWKAPRSPRAVTSTRPNSRPMPVDRVSPRA